MFGADGRLKLSNRAFAGLWRLDAGGARRRAACRRGRRALPRRWRPRTSAWSEIRGAVAGLTEMRMGYDLPHGAARRLGARLRRRSRCRTAPRS